MFDRFERPLKIVCLGFAALLVWQLCQFILRGDPLANVKIPAVPSLREPTNAPVKSIASETQVHLDKIVDSEILGPAIRPAPLSLIGIAGEDAFIQATNGQTGPVKLGGEMGGIKLLRIGVNRVLVEDNGEKKELTLFGGMGGESLMPKETNAPSTHAPITNVSTNQNISAKQQEKK